MARSISPICCSTSRSSRFIESGPWLRCLPPVTVTLWKHSPDLREEERIGIFQRQIAADVGIGHDVAVAQLGQNHFQRFAEAVEHANAMLQRNHAVAVRDLVRRLVEDERELRLRIFGMDQERRAAIHVAAQQAQTFVGGVPRLHHDVVQLVAQEIVDHVLVAVFHFEKVGEHADRREALLASRPR